MLDLLKDLAKALIRGFAAILVPILLVVGGAALIGLGVDNDWSIAVWIGAGLVLAGIVWGAVLYMMHG